MLSGSGFRQAVQEKGLSQPTLVTGASWPPCLVPCLWLALTSVLWWQQVCVGRDTHQMPAHTRCQPYFISRHFPLFSFLKLFSFTSMWIKAISGELYASAPHFLNWPICKKPLKLVTIIEVGRLALEVSLHIISLGCDLQKLNFSVSEVSYWIGGSRWSWNFYFLLLI